MKAEYLSMLDYAVATKRLGGPATSDAVATQDLSSFSLDLSEWNDVSDVTVNGNTTAKGWKPEKPILAPRVPHSTGTPIPGSRPSVIASSTDVRVLPEAWTPSTTTRSSSRDGVPSENGSSTRAGPAPSDWWGPEPTSTTVSPGSLARRSRAQPRRRSTAG